MKLRVGLVGIGQGRDSHYRGALRALADRFEVRAVCSDVALRAEQIAGEFQARSVDGYRALAAREDVDAVLLLAPDWYGPLPVYAACDFGKALFCTSTWEIEARHAHEMKARVEQSGIAFMAEFARRHAPATLRLKELIATRLGEPRMVLCHRRLGTAAVNDATHRGVARGSVPRDVLELVDWCCYVVGKTPTSVLGVQHEGVSGAEEYGYQMINLGFENQAGESSSMAQINCGQLLPPTWKEAISFRPPAELQVCCEHGVAFLDLPSTLIWFDEAGRHHESLESERPVGEQLLTQFHRAVTSLVRRTSDLEDTYRSLNIVEMARMSAQEGRRLILD